MARRVIDREAAQRRVCEALTAGNTRRAACAFAGIGESTLDRWLDRYGDFGEAVKKAEGDAEVRNVAIIARAAQTGTWQAAAWWLERRYPHDYGRTVQQVEHTGAGGGPMQVTFRISHPTDALRAADPLGLPEPDEHQNGRAAG